MEHLGSKNVLKKIFSPLLDIIFPKFCLGCRKEGYFLCDHCYKNIYLSLRSECVVCGKKACFDNHICQKCLEDFKFDSLFVMSAHKGLLKELISLLKFDYIEEISGKLAEFFAISVDKAGLVDKLNGNSIIPIPLHKKRFLERGFNQSELISEKICKFTDMSLDLKSLHRIKNTKQQANLKKEQRIENMKNAFCANFDKKPEKVYLFDDVFTTGQTMNEAAKALKAAGVKEVNVLALAHGK